MYSWIDQYTELVLTLPFGIEIEIIVQSRSLDRHIGLLIVTLELMYFNILS
jgi:hypothetical protein